MTERAADPSAPIPEDRLPLAVFRITCAALGYPAKDIQPPPPVAAFAAAMRAAVEAMLAAPADSRNNAPGDPLRKASAGAVFAAVAGLARLGLLPGIPGTPATGYLYAQNGALTGRPSPLGRVRMAYQAGADVETTAVGQSCILEMGKDGLVAAFERNPDNVPRRLEDLRGVVVSVTSHASGVVKMHWVSAGEIGDRRERSKQKNGGAWASDPVTMARTKALYIIGDRGGFPQSPLPIPGLRKWQAAQAALPQLAPALPAAAPRALPAPAAEPSTAPPDDAPAPDAPPAAAQGPQDAPPPEPAPATTDDAPAQPEPPQAPPGEAGAPAAAPTWDDVGEALMSALATARPNRAGDHDDLHAAAAGAIREAQATAGAKGRTLSPAAALDPAALARLTTMGCARLDAM